jgi:hypothetical protein
MSDSPSVTHAGKIVALASLALSSLACGGAISSPGGGNAGGNAGRGAAGNGPGGSESGDTGGSGGLPGECPPGQPRNGSICVTPGQTCDYVPASCAGCQCEYHCWNGQWVEDGSGCAPPPPPPPPVEVCPADRPKDGTYCGAAPSNGCTYVASFCLDQPNGWATYYCADNIWRAGPSTIGPCNPPPVFTCPAQIPAAGTPCALPTGGDASVPFCYYACTLEAPTIIASCGIGSRWTLAARPCAGDGGVEGEGPGDARGD